MLVKICEICGKYVPHTSDLKTIKFEDSFRFGVCDKCFEYYHNVFKTAFNKVQNDIKEKLK
jgi:ribosome-binding protein aMBF1 (putative translation factor)